MHGDAGVVATAKLPGSLLGLALPAMGGPSQPLGVASAVAHPAARAWAVLSRMCTGALESTSPVRCALQEAG
eukprot:4034029-Alexandrium_andersonii.AAC.1